MKGEKVDQRVKLTQVLLKNALVQLIKEQHISKISVRALCDAAGINRSTFYNHYADPYDLLMKIKQEIIGDIGRYINSQSINAKLPLSAQLLTRILEYFQDNVELFRSLLGENSDSSFQKDIMELAQVISEHVNPGFDPRTLNYIKTFGVTGSISVIQCWLQEGMADSPARMAELLIQLLYGGQNGLRNMS